MVFLDIVVKHDGTDITTSTVSFNRDHNICTGIGTLEVIVPLAIGRTFHPWDVLEIWENGDKKGLFYIDDVDKSAAGGTIMLKATDGSKKLTDHFYTENHIIDYASFSRYWIEFFLDAAGVSYTITASGQGTPISNNTSLGFDSTFNIIQTLLQQTGWYIYFDSDGTAIVGNLNKDINNPDHTVDGTDITQIERELDDDRLRNRAVVWGNSNPTFGEVFVDISVQTPWNYDANDERAVVLSNSSIYNNAQALTLANMMLNEFTEIKDEKLLSVANDSNIQIGDIIKVDTAYWSGRGLVTGVNAVFGLDGLVYQITVNQKCPRLFTFFSTLPPTVSGFYVYVGTQGDGIKRRYVHDSTWSDDSSGLEVLSVSDLFIRNGNFATIAGGNLYTRSTEAGYWSKYSPPILRDIDGNLYPSDELTAQACSINLADNVVVGYNYATVSGIPASGISWVLEMTAPQNLLRAEQVVVSGSGSYTIFDLESAGEYNIVTTSGEASSEFSIDFDLNGYGNRSNQFSQMYLTEGFFDTTNIVGDPDVLNAGLQDGIPAGSLSPSIGQAATGFVSQPIKDGNLAYSFGNNRFVVYDLSDMTQTDYYFTEPTNWTGGTYVRGYLRKKTSTTFDLVVVHYVSGTWKVVHGVYTLGDDPPTANIVATADDTGAAYTYQYGTALIGNQIVIHYLDQGLDATYDTMKILAYNLDTSTVNDFIYSDNAIEKTNSRTAYYMIPNGDYVICAAFYIDWNTNEYLHLKCVYGSVSSFGITSTGGPTTLRSYYPNWTSISDASLNGGSLSSRSKYVSATSSNYQFAYNLVDIKWIDIEPSVGDRWNYVTLSVQWLGRTPNVVAYREELLLPVGSTWNDPNVEHNEGSGNYSIINSQNVGGGISSKYHGAHYIRWMQIDSINYMSIMDSSLNSVALIEFNTTTPFGTNFTFTGHSAVASDINGTMYVVGTRLFGIRDGNVVVEQGSSQWNNPFLFGKQMGRYAKSGKSLIIFSNPNLLEEIAGTEGTVLKHTSTTTISGFTASDETAEQTQGIFEVIADTEVPCKVDINKGVPTVIYSLPETISGGSILAASVTNTPGSFYQHAVDQQVYESRSFDLVRPGAFPSISGIFSEEDFERYIGVCNIQGLLASDYFLQEPWVNMVTVASGIMVSGIITHFESTNYVPEGTYLFYTISGIPSFFQKNPENAYWLDYSIGLPSSDITIIRIDDLI